MAGSRELSLAVHFTPLSASAGARLGLSTGCWGATLRPECSPVTSSERSVVIPLDAAQLLLSLICLEMSALLVHWTAPRELVWQVQGLVATFCRHPRNRCV